MSMMCVVDSGSGGDAGGVYRPVYVSAVEHPEHFWMQMLSERSTQLDSLISEMTSFYETQVSIELLNHIVITSRVRTFV